MQKHSASLQVKTLVVILDSLFFFNIKSNVSAISIGSALKLNQESYNFSPPLPLPPQFKSPSFLTCLAPNTGYLPHSSSHSVLFKDTSYHVATLFKISHSVLSLSEWKPKIPYNSSRCSGPWTLTWPFPSPLISDPTFDSSPWLIGLYVIPQTY